MALEKILLWHHGYMQAEVSFLLPSTHEQGDHNKNFGRFLLEYPATHDSSLEAKMSETAKLHQLNYINSIERNCQLGTRLIHVKLYLSVLSLGNACMFSQVPQSTLLRDRKTCKIFINFSCVRKEPNGEPRKKLQPIKGWISRQNNQKRKTNTKQPTFFGSSLAVLGFVFTFVFIGSQP